MTNRNALLGRSRPREKLTREEIAALDEATVPPVPPAKPPGKKGGGTQRVVRKDLLKFHWSLECPGCGFKVTGNGQPSPGNVWRGAAAASWSSSWAAGDASDNPEYVNQEASMTETEMLKEPRIIVAKVAHADQASGRVPDHVLQAKVKVREELVSAVKEKYEAYLATAN